MATRFQAMDETLVEAFGFYLVITQTDSAGNVNSIEVPLSAADRFVDAINAAVWPPTVADE